MKVIIAGSRTMDPTDEDISGALRWVHWMATEIVSGTAPGVDSAGERWAKANDIPVKRFPADWERYGKSAGPRRNAEMADYADAALLFWDGKSPGTRNMFELMVKRGKPVCHEMV